MWGITIPGVWLFITSIVGLVMLFGRTGPAEAASNLSKWIEKTGLHRLAATLRSPSVARRLFRAATISMGVLLFIGGVGVGRWWYNQALVSQKSGSAQPTLPPSVQYLNNVDFISLDKKDPRGLLIIRGSPTQTKHELRVFAEFSLYSQNYWMPSTRVPVGVIDHPVKGVAVELPIFVEVKKGSMDEIVIGDPEGKSFLPSYSEPIKHIEVFRLRLIVIDGDNDEEQYVERLLIELPSDWSPRLMIVDYDK